MHRHRQLHARRVAVAVALSVASSAFALRAQTAPPQVRTGAMPQVIAIDDFKALHARGAVLAIDVRSKGAFDAGHIDGALNVPLDELESRAGEIRKQAKNREIVTYCSCPAEHASLAGADLLIRKGLSRVRALQGGYDAWLATGGKAVRKSFHTRNTRRTKTGISRNSSV